MSIHVKNLTHRYGSVTALQDVTAVAAPGAITAVLGPNASGKSTLLRCIIGALTPTSGSVLLNGEAAHSMSTRHLAETLAYVPQRSTVAAAFTVREVVELGRYVLPPSRERVQQAMARMDVADVADRPYALLSVGQQQRVTLARALAQLGENGHLVLDEPTSAMDLRHVRSVMGLLRELADHGATILLAVHDLTLAAQVADEAWLLDDGRLVAAGTACDVLEVQRLKAVYGVEFQWLQGRLLSR